MEQPVRLEPAPSWSGQAEILTPLVEVDRPQRLTPVHPAGALPDGESVVLRNRLAGAERARPPASRTPADRPERGAATVASGASAHDGEVPLWKRLAYLLQPSAELLLTAGGPLEWPASLFDYQLDGIQALLAREALLLADDMGLGKTIQTIAALRILALRQELTAGLIVVPASLVSQWRQVIRQWAPELRVSTVRGAASERAWQWKTPAPLYLTSYETLRADFTENPQSPPRQRTWDVVVLDEAQRIKNRETEISHKCKRLARRRAWALTGTPLENRLDDLASLLEFVRPNEAGSRPAVETPGARVVERLQTVQLRRRKRDVLTQLPPKLSSTILLHLDGAQRRAYELAEQQGVVELRERGQRVTVANVLELITRLKQLCNFCPGDSSSEKLADLEQRLETLVAEGHRALVFSQFTDGRFGARAIVERLAAFQPLLFTGDLSMRERDAVIERFQSDDASKVLVLSLRAGGQGLNLQQASYVFHFDRWWNPAVEHQAEDRSHRLGQTSPVHVYKYVCEDTIEERIDQIIQGKQQLFDELVDEVSLALPSVLNEEELFGLFGLAAPMRRRSSPGLSGTAEP